MITRGNPWYGIYYSMKAIAIIKGNINNIGMKIIPLLNRFIIINNTLWNGPWPRIYSQLLAGIYPAWDLPYWPYSTGRNPHFSVNKSAHLAN